MILLVMPLSGGQLRPAMATKSIVEGVHKFMRKSNMLERNLSLATLSTIYLTLSHDVTQIESRAITYTLVSKDGLVSVHDKDMTIYQ
jgi:hypothetical protein